MPYWCAAFGPNNSYFFNSPHKWSMCGLPDRINSLFTTEPKANEIHEIALGPNGSYAILFTDSTGIKVRHSGLPQAIEQWLLNYSGRAINSARDLATLQISLGPNNSYFAFDKNGCIWGGLPPALDAAINERKDSNGCFKPGAYPYLVSLGAQGTYAMITVGGGGSWHFGGHKPQLEQYVNEMGSLMHVGVILSPFDINHYLLVTGQGHVAGFGPEMSAPAYLAFADDWRSSIQAETIPPPPAGPPVQTECLPQLPPRRPSSIAADAQIRHSHVPYMSSHENRPSLPARPFSDTMPAYTAYAPHTSQTVGLPPPPLSPQPNTSTLQAQAVPKPSPPLVQRRPVKRQENPFTLSPKLPATEQTPYFPPPPPYSPNPAAIPLTEIKNVSSLNPTSATPINTPQVRQAQQTQPAAAAQDYVQAKAAAKAKRNQRIATGLKVGKMAMQGVSIGLALVNIASGNGASIPSFDFGSSDVPVPDVPDAPDVPVPDTSAYWQPLQDCASMPIQ